MLPYIEKIFTLRHIFTDNTESVFEIHGFITLLKEVENTLMSHLSKFNIILTKNGGEKENVTFY